jgi:hypothetical protein
MTAHAGIPRASEIESRTVQGQVFKPLMESSTSMLFYLRDANFYQMPTAKAMAMEHCTPLPAAISKRSENGRG